MKILALSTDYPYFQDILAELEKKGIIISHVTSHLVERDLKISWFYKQNQNKINFIEGIDFYNINKLRKVLPDNYPALSKKIIEDFEDIERDFYILSDRYCHFPKSFRERKRLFRAGLKYWFAFFENNQLDGVFSICTPHSFPDFLAFHVAQYLGINTVMTTDVMINNHTLFLRDYREQYKVPENYLKGLSDAKIKAKIPQSLYDNCFAESNEMAFAKKLNDKTLGVGNLNQEQEEEEDAPSKHSKLMRKTIAALSLSSFKPTWKGNFAMNGIYSGFSRRIFREISCLRLKKLKKDYEHFAITPDLGKKYIYFAMHLNPERTSQPEAGLFEDHLLAIEILSASVPKDWLIYVKENPSQYGRTLNLMNGKHHRDREDYEDFARLKNVRLIRQDVKSKDLIANAKVVATLKGSVVWESIHIGKAGIIFSNAWYSACRAAIDATDVESCKKAIKAAQAKSAKEVHTDVLKFLAYMQNRIKIGSMGGHFNIDLATVPYEELVGSYTQKIYDMLMEGSVALEAQKIPA